MHNYRDKLIVGINVIESKVKHSIILCSFN